SFITMRVAPAETWARRFSWTGRSRSTSRPVPTVRPRPICPLRGSSNEPFRAPAKERYPFDQKSSVLAGGGGRARRLRGVSVRSHSAGHLPRWGGSSLRGHAHRRHHGGPADALSRRQPTLL